MSSKIKGIEIFRGTFLTRAKPEWEFVHDFIPNRDFLQDLKAQGVDLFSFVERTFLGSINEKNKHHMKLIGARNEIETIGLLPTSSYEIWFKSLKSHIRRSIRASKRKGVQVRIPRIDDKFIGDALTIYNETPNRQGRRYCGYGISFQNLKNRFLQSDNGIVFGAYYKDKLIGFVWMMSGDRVAQIGTFLHLVSQRRMHSTSILIDTIAKFCSERGIEFLVYPTAFGFQPGLDTFRRRIGFAPYKVIRHYLPITTRGYASIRLNAHLPIQYLIPCSLRIPLRTIFNHISLVIPSPVWYRIGGR